MRASFRLVTRVIAGSSLLLATSLFLAAKPIKPAPLPANLVSGLVWRSVGPFRGGRVSAVSGVIGNPGTFYIGLPLGGVWKTTSAGTTWYPVFDGIKAVSSIGSVEVAPSDSNIIYAGTGDLITGGGVNEGNGMYKSVDAGKTWQHLGLDDSKQIPSILVDPHNPDLVLVAAQGNIHATDTTRGVYRSTDGGKTWSKTLYVDSVTGMQKLAWAYDHPDVILATSVRHYTPPGGAGRGGFGGGGAGAPASDTHLFKSTDEGVTWKEITGGGLPASALNGRTSVAIAMHTNAQRMFLITNTGLFRSDDGGTSWRQMDAGDTRIRNGQGGYNCGVYVDPQNPDVVYTVNTSSYKSTDGGNTFTGFKGAPGGDDPQQFWIDPTNGQRILLGADQGATVSLDGGRTWSLWYNQATTQVYHISTDNQYPYWIYASQQDAGSIATRSRGDLGEITSLDWLPIPGYEFGTVVTDPLDPKIVYAGGPGSGIVKITYPSAQWINISPNMVAAEALRKVGNQPILFSPTNPHELLVGFNYLMSSTDGGAHWTKLGPDLTFAKGETPPPAGRGGRGGRGAAGAAGGRAPVGNGAIESFSLSTVTPGIIWVGTNNGLIKLTRNHGATWEDVSIADLPNASRADISTIDASHQDAGAAYVAIDYHATGDYKPYVYRTHDYGKTWTKIVNGMRDDQPSGSFARTIRADTKKAGLLYAGTESSMYVSFDDGDNWQSLMFNLPNTSYRDIQIHDNDLVVGTYGRGIWILDDISPLRQMTDAIAAEPAHLFKPGDAIRVRRDVNGDTPFPPEVPHALNPPPGVILYYYLGAKPAGEITLDVLDAAGKPVRHLSSAPIAPYDEPPPPVPDFWIAAREPMPADAGTNRINWDMRYDPPPAYSHNYGQMMGAVPFDTPPSPEGPLALPGVYTFKLTVDGKTYTQTATIRNDPRSPASAADLVAQHAMQMQLYDGAREAWDGNHQATTMRDAVNRMKQGPLPPDLDSAVTAFDSALVRVGGAAGGGRGGRGGGFGGRGGRGGGPTPPPNFEALNGTMLRQLDMLDPGDMAPTQPMIALFTTNCGDLKQAVTTWRTINTRDLPAFNAIATKHSFAPIEAASPMLPVPVCVSRPVAAKPAARQVTH